MIASGKNAWKREERLRLWFEVVFDTTVEPPDHCAYLCKCCWEQFLANTDFVRLMAHAGGHEAKHESPYSQPRPSPITGEQVCELYGAILECYERVTPEVGTWKFQCRKCKKLLPHRTAHKDLMLHAKACAVTKER